MTGMASRRLASVSNITYDGIPSFTCAKHGIFWRRRHDSCRDARRRFSIVSTFLCSTMLNIAPVCGVAMTGVATLGVGFPVSCLMTSRGLPMLNMTLLGGVAMTGVATPGAGLPASFQCHP
jgi:hypothetical protein